MFSLDFPYAYGKPLLKADFRSQNADFKVTEVLGFALSSEGEHYCLEIKKSGHNTLAVSDCLAKILSIKTMDIGVCGMKDRHAETIQWFSIYLPRVPEPDTVELSEKLNAQLGGGIEILKTTRHHKKLRRGDHQANRFDITLRNVEGDIDASQQRWKQLVEQGVPNYFGEQRFGRDCHNLELAKRWFENDEPIRNKKLRGFVMSAARSWLFNLVLSERVNQQTWSTAISGDIAIAERGPTPTAPLWGRGKSLVTDDALILEQSVLSDYAQWQNGLEHCGLNQERRECVLWADHASFTVMESDQICLSFFLGSGNFATTLLRELCVLNNAADRPSLVI